MDYAELHCHSYYSFHDGASSLEELMVRARDLGYRVLAVTDHDNLCGAMNFAQLAKSLDMHGVIGAEVTLGTGCSSTLSPVALRQAQGERESESRRVGGAQRNPSTQMIHGAQRNPPLGAVVRPPDTQPEPEPFHLTLLAKDRKGYGNLCRLITAAHAAGERNEPQLPQELLPQHAEGLICLSGCRNGELARLVDAARFEEAERLIRRYLDWFGPENYYVELQQNLVYGDTERNRRLASLAKTAGARIVATGNVHYHDRARHKLQDCLVAVKHCASLEESHRERRANSEFYLRSTEELGRLFRDYPEALANTVDIAERCTFDLTGDQLYSFPDFKVPAGYTPQTYLETICYEAAIRRYGSVTAPVRRRLDEEFRLIRKFNLAGFLLMYHEVIKLGRDVMIDLGLSDPSLTVEENPPGRGRGSSVALLAGYLIGLSHIDPLQYSLSLERFLPDDVMSGPPDIDLDFPRSIREELILRTHKKWGWEHAALAGTISTYQIKGAVRDLGKALGLPEAEIDQLAKQSDWGSARKLRAKMERMPNFRDKVDVPVWRDLIELAAELDGFPKYMGQHPGGMILSSTPLTEIVPIQRGAIDGRYVCQWDKDSIDDAGFVKIDFLALGALSQMQEAIELIAQRTGKRVDMSRIDFEDNKVYDMLCSGDTIGIFQVESAAQMQTITRLQPRNLLDMAHEVAAVRPGVGVNNGVYEYLARRNGYKPIEYDHPLEKRALERTLGVILFQDQVNQLAIDIAGFPPSEADRLRRAFGRKHNTELLENYRKRFLAGAAERGVEEETADRIFEKFTGQYMFPESHAFAFGVTAYQASWLKYYYPLEFFVAIFNQQPMGFYNLETLKEDAKRHGVKVLNPDINLSRDKCVIAEEPRSAGSFPSPLTGEGSAGLSLRASASGGPKQSVPPPDRVGQASLPVRAAAGAEARATHNQDCWLSGETSREASLSSFLSPPRERIKVRGNTNEFVEPSSPFSSTEGESRRVGEAQRNPPAHATHNQDCWLAGEIGRVGEAQRNPPLEAVSMDNGQDNAPNGALRLGFLHVEGLGPAAAEAITNARKNGPFTSIGDFLERTGVLEEVALNLAGAGAFDSLQPNRRTVKWEIGLRYRPINTQLPLPLPVTQDIVPLQSLTDWERMREEYSILSLYPEGHVMQHLRPRFSKGFVTSRDIGSLRDNAAIKAAGMVIRRQRPRGKVVFITLEDEFGHIPCMVFGKTYEKFEHTFRSPFLIVKGNLTRREGTCNLVIRHVEAFSAIEKMPKSKDWH